MANTGFSYELEPKMESKFRILSLKLRAQFVATIETLSVYFWACVAFIFLVPFYCSWLNSDEIIEKYPQLFDKDDRGFYTALLSACLFPLLSVWLADLLAVCSLFLGIRKGNTLALKAGLLKPYQYLLRSRIAFHLMLAFGFFTAYLWSEGVKRFCINLFLHVATVAYVMFNSLIKDLLTIDRFIEKRAEVADDVYGWLGCVAPVCIVLGVCCLTFAFINYSFHKIVSDFGRSIDEKTDEDEKLEHQFFVMS